MPSVKRASGLTITLPAVPSDGRFVPSVTTDGDTLALLQQTSAQQQSVNIRKISKTFDKTTAVREVTTSMLPNEVTALLGQKFVPFGTSINERDQLSIGFAVELARARCST